MLVHHGGVLTSDGAAFERCSVASMDTSSGRASGGAVAVDDTLSFHRIDVNSYAFIDSWQSGSVSDNGRAGFRHSPNGFFISVFRHDLWGNVDGNVGLTTGLMIYDARNISSVLAGPIESSGGPYNHTARQIAWREEVPSDPNKFNALAWAPNSSLIATGTTFGRIELWAVAADGSMQLLRASAVGANLFTNGYGFDSRIVADLAFSPDASKIYVASHVLQVWDATDLSNGPMHQKRLFDNTGAYGQQLTSISWGLALSADGSRIAVGQSMGTINWIFDTATIQERAVPIVTWTAHLQTASTASSGSTYVGVVDAEFTPDGSRLISIGRDGKLIVIEFGNGTSATIVSSHQATVGVRTAASDDPSMLVPPPLEAMSLSADGKRLVTIATDAITMHAVDLHYSSPPPPVQGATAGSCTTTSTTTTDTVGNAFTTIMSRRLGTDVATSGGMRVTMSPGGDRVVTGGHGDSMQAWDVTDTRPFASETFTADRASIDYSPDGAYILTGSFLKYDATDLGASPDATPEATLGDDLVEYTNAGGSQTIETVTRPQYTPSGDEIIVGSSLGTLRVLSANDFSILRKANNTGAQLLTGQVATFWSTYDDVRGVINALAISADGTRLAVSERGSLSIWDVTTLTELHRPWDVTHKLDPTWGTMEMPDYLAEGCIDFSPDGTRLVTAEYARGMLRVWDMTTNSSTPLTEFDAAWGWDAGRPRMPKGVRFSADGTRLIGTCENSQVRIFNATNLMTYEDVGTSYTGVEALTVSANRQYVIITGAGFGLEVRDWSWNSIFSDADSGLSSPVMSRDNNRVALNGKLVHIGSTMEPSLSFKSTRFDNCTASTGEAAAIASGGGVATYAGHVAMTDCVLAGCSAESTGEGGRGMGGGVFVAQSTFDVSATEFQANAASMSGSALTYESRPSFTSVSSLTLSTFAGNNAGDSSTVFAPTPITWGCQIGQWSGPTGRMNGDFVGCVNLCAAGSVGVLSNHTDPTCGGSCPIGHYCIAGTGNVSGSPEPCPTGYYMPVIGAAAQASCIPCSPGAHMPTSGASICTPCGIGTYTAVLAAATCDACPVGGFCGQVGAASASQTFEQCPAGTYNPSTGSSSIASCIGCPAGKANPVPGSSSASVCTGCLPGSYAGVVGTDVCTLCAPGTFTSQSGQTACEPCTSGCVQFEISNGSPS